MINFMAFLSYFVSYLLVFIVFAVLIILGCVLGIKWRKSKDAKASLEQNTGEKQ